MLCKRIHGAEPQGDSLGIWKAPSQPDKKDPDWISDSCQN